MTKRFRWLSVLFALAMLVTSVAPVLAQEEPVDEPAEGEQVEPIAQEDLTTVFIPLVSSNSSQDFPPPDQQIPIQQQALIDAINQADEKGYLTFGEEGNVVLDIENAANLEGVDEGTFQQLVEAVDFTNDLLEAGDLTVDDLMGLNQGPLPGRNPAQPQRFGNPVIDPGGGAGGPPGRLCYGERGHKYHYTGPLLTKETYYMDTCDVDDIVALATYLGAGSLTAASLATAMKNAKRHITVPLAIVSGIVGVGPTIWAQQDKGKGIACSRYFNYFPPHEMVWTCGPQ